MRNYNLSFITNKDLYNHVKETVSKYRFDMNLSSFNKNIIDPIKLTFDSKVYNKAIQEVIENEVLRQIDKSNTNHIGYFHQNIFNFIGDGWSVPKIGYDVEHSENSYYVEMKNKHNTMNSSSSQKTFMRMQNTIMKNPDALCMLVEVIAKKSQNITWETSLDYEKVADDRIRRVSIDKFYEFVTGEKEAFKNLCQVLPIVLEDIIAKENVCEKQEANTVFNELMAISPDLEKSIYLLAFKNYEGFDAFNI